MVKVDERVARCLGMMRSSDFEPLMTYLRALRQEQLEMMAVAIDMPHIHKFQGKADILKTLIEFVDNNDALIKKLKR